MGSREALNYLVKRFTTDKCEQHYLETYISLGGQLHIYNDAIIKAAIEQGRLVEVKYLVEKDPARYKRPILLDTLIKYCIYKDQLEIAEYLSEQADINNSIYA